VLSLVVQGKKIDAIAQLREETGLGLADAKRVVEELEGR
jgi:ribosomal protein L7/L12